jgi:hypothetical protein
MDGQDYRFAAVLTWREAGRKADPDLARAYRSLAGAYLALARFRDRIEQRHDGTWETGMPDRRQEH